MLAYLLVWARHTHIIRKINLRMRVDNLSAIHLYEKYGFVREGRRTREFYLHGQFVDVFLMGLQLDYCSSWCSELPGISPVKARGQCLEDYECGWGIAQDPHQKKSENFE